MSDYDFNKYPHAPFAKGKTPRMAWYLIEPWDRDKNRIPDGEDAKGKPVLKDVMEVIDRKTAEGLVKDFDLADWMDKGIPVNLDHLHLYSDSGATKAYGWIKALYVDEAGLWALIEWTDEGHALVNGDAYAFFSTEYPYKYYIIGPDTDEETGLPIARPGKLYGLAITNYPANRRQDSMTHSARLDGQLRCRRAAAINKTTSTNMPGQRKQTKKTARTKSEEEMKTDPNAAAPAEDETTTTATNSEEETTETTETNSEEQTTETTECNAEAEEFWTSLLTTLGLDPEDTETTKDDVLAAVEALAKDNDDMRSKLKTNRVKMGAAARLARLGFTATRREQAKAPEDSPNLKPGQMTAEQREMAEYVDKRLKEARTRRETQGKPWRPQDYTGTVAEAQREFASKRSK